MASEVIQRSMYNGLHDVVHNPNARGSQPRYLVNGTNKPKGVTTILGSTLAKDFVGWALNCMEEVLLKGLPHLTEADIAYAKAESTRRRDSGADTGTEAHALVEEFLKGISTIDRITAASEEAQKAYGAFTKWFIETKPTVINVEEVIYSAEYDYAGCYDAMMEIDGKVYLTDLKTTNASRKAPNGVYAEYFIQLGAYAAAHEEQRLYEEANGGSKLPKVEGIAVISARKDGKLTFVTNEELGLDLTVCGDLFKDIVKISRFLTSTTKLLGGK